jgi:protein-tyrosine phosphatase
MSNPTGADATPSSVRWIAFEGSENFRDLGGQVTDTGDTVRYGLIYRSDTLDSLTDEDHQLLDTLGIATVIDLRARSEVESCGRLDLRRHEVRYVYLPLIDIVGDSSMWDDPNVNSPEFPIRGYRQMLTNGEARMADVLNVLAEPGALPAVFHCRAGKDRTGLVAALVLRLLGVSAADVATEYALSDGRTRHSAASTEMKQRYPYVFGAPPGTMLGLLSGIDEAHGSVAEYVASLGVQPDVPERLRRALLTSYGHDAG